MSRHHVVVPYPVTNSSVRTRAVHWIDRLVASGRIERADVVLHGPGNIKRSVPPGTDLLLLRQIGRVTRGRSEARLLRAASNGVYDLDDGLPWDDGRLPGLGRWWKRPFPRSLLSERSAQASDRVIAGNDRLATWAAERCDDVRVVPTCVEPSDYRIRTSWIIGGPAPRIGWIGSRATEPYLRDIAAPLAELHRRTGARLDVISGDGPLAPELAPFATKQRWRADSPSLIAAWDIGIMPLRDGVYERAKCGYKLLQYAASGVPAIGAPVGVNERLLREMDGLAPTTEDEWADALTHMVDEAPTRRAQRAASGLEVARAHSYDVWEPAWLDAVGW